MLYLDQRNFNMFPYATLEFKLFTTSRLSQNSPELILIEIVDYDEIIVHFVSIQFYGFHVQIVL